MNRVGSPGDQEWIMVASGAAARRNVVAQATVVLAAQFGIDPETAGDKLAGVARDEDRAIHDVAAVVVEQNGL